jgi:hypothetical protein
MLHFGYRMQLVILHIGTAQHSYQPYPVSAATNSHLPRLQGQLQRRFILASAYFVYFIKVLCCHPYPKNDVAHQFVAQPILLIPVNRFFSTPYDFISAIIINVLDYMCNAKL